MDYGNGTISDNHASALLSVDNVAGIRSLSTVIHLIGCSILSFCLALRSYREDFFSIRGLQSISWARWLVVIIFVDSWLFIFFAGVLVNGVGISSSDMACELGIFACIFFYDFSKVFIYLFLIERVYIVWPNHGLTRWSSTAYRVCIASMAGYGVVFVLMILERIAFRQQDGQCIIGLGRISSLILLMYDLFLNLFLTGMFLYPLRKNKFLSTKLQRLARRTLAAATMSLITSAVNIAVLTILHGQELGWVCLGSCGTDITVNALVLFWVTGSGDETAAGAGPSPGPTTQANDLSTIAPSSPADHNKPALDSRNDLALQQDLPIRQRAPHLTHAIHFSVAGRDDKMHVVLPDNGEGAIPETVTSESRHEFGRERVIRRRPNSSNHRQSIVTRFMQALGFWGYDTIEESGSHSMSVQVTVATQTDAMVTSSKQHQRRSESISSSRPRDAALEPQHLTEIGPSMNEDLERGPQG